MEKELMENLKHKSHFKNCRQTCAKIMHLRIEVAELLYEHHQKPPVASKMKRFKAQKCETIAECDE